MLSCISGSVPSEKNVHSFKFRGARLPPACKVGRWWIVAVGGHFPRREINAHSCFAGARTHPFNIAVRGREWFSPPCLVDESSGRFFRSGRERNPFRVVKRGKSNRKMRPSREGVPRSRAGQNRLMRLRVHRPTSPTPSDGGRAHEGQPCPAPSPLNNAAVFPARAAGGTGGVAWVLVGTLGTVKGRSRDTYGGPAVSSVFTAQQCSGLSSADGGGRRRSCLGFCRDARDGLGTV